MRSVTVSLVLACLAVFLAGCSGPSLQVMAMGNASVGALSPDDIARTMRAAGFSDEDILQAGPDVRDVLAQSGVAGIKRGNKVEAIFALDGKYVYVSSQRRGSFIYDLDTGKFK